MRTELEQDADQMDMEVHRLLCRLTGLLEKTQGGVDRALLIGAYDGLRSARNCLRTLMHDEDREVTKHSVPI